MLQTCVRNLYPLSEKGTVIKRGLRTGLNQGVMAGWGVRLQRSHWSATSRLHGAEWSNQSTRCFPPNGAHIFLSTGTHTHTHVKPHRKAVKTPRTCTGWSSLAPGHTENHFLVLFLDTEKHRCFSAASSNLFSMCWPSFPRRPGSYSNTEDGWSCWGERWHGYAPAGKQKSASSIH